MAIEKANQILTTNEDYYGEIRNKITYELTWWDKVPTENKSNEEYVVQIYKPLKRLISAFEQKKDAEEKSKVKK